MLLRADGLDMGFAQTAQPYSTNVSIRRKNTGYSTSGSSQRQAAFCATIPQSQIVNPKSKIQNRKSEFGNPK